jgi:hypothetical protein
MAQQISVNVEKDVTQAYEPLLPVERKLIVWSLIIGVALLGILILVSYTFFPGSF